MRGSWPLRLLVPAIIVAALIIDATLGEPGASTADQIAPQVANEVAVPPAEILTSTWFCPVVYMREVTRPAAEQPAQPNTEQDGTADEFVPLEITTEIQITNITDRTVQALLELNSTRDSESLPLVIGPYETQVVDVSEVEVEPGELMSAVVEIAGGGVAVTRRLTSSTGVDQARCASSVSAQWEIPLGDTQADARSLVAIHNPLPRYAVVDVSLASDVEPGAFNVPELQGLVIPGRSTKVIDVADFARRRTVASATVFVRTGRTAVDHITVYDGSVGRTGFSAELAIPATSETWLMPLAGIDDLTHAHIRVSNPNDELAEIEVIAVSGFVSAADNDGDVAPYTDAVLVVVLPNDVTEIKLAASTTAEPDSHTLLVDVGVPVAISVRSLNALAVAAALEVLVGDATKPSVLGDLPFIEHDEEEDQASEDPGDFGEGLEVFEEVPEPAPPIFDAPAGLAAVPGHAVPRTRWLLVIPPNSGAQANTTQTYITLMTMPPVAGTIAGSQTDDAGTSSPDSNGPGSADSDSADSDGGAAAPSQSSQAAVVVVRQLDGEQLGTITVPTWGAVTAQLASGSIQLLESEVPFVPIVYQFVSQAHGLSGIVALPY